MHGLQTLVSHPERAAWSCAPQHYFITQDGSNGECEALLVCEQGDRLANGKPVRLSSPAETIAARKHQYRTPYEMPSHLIAMDVSVDAIELEADEEITHQLEIRTANPFKPSKNERGFVIARLDDTVFLHRYNVRLSDSYKHLFRQEGSLSMYVCITAEGQDIVLTAIRPHDWSQIPDIEWLTLPEILGTFGADSVETFQLSICVTAAVKQSTLPLLNR